MTWIAAEGTFWTLTRLEQARSVQSLVSSARLEILLF